MSATRIELRADYFQGWLAEAIFYVNVGAGCPVTEMGFPLRKMRSLAYFILALTNSCCSLWSSSSSSLLPSFRSSAVTPPQFDGLVVLERGGGDDVLGGVAGRAQDDVRVAEQLLHDLLRLQVPDVHLRRSGFNVCAGVSDQLVFIERKEMACIWQINFVIKLY